MTSEVGHKDSAWRIVMSQHDACLLKIVANTPDQGQGKDVWVDGGDFQLCVCDLSSTKAI